MPPASPRPAIPCSTCDLPFDEPYRIPAGTAAAIAEAKAEGGRIIAIGTTVVRALEAAANADGVRAGDGVARGRIERDTPLRVVDAILTGVHQPGESHFELLRAFADDAVLDRVTAALAARGYRAHEFGDSMLLERQASHASHRHDELLARRVSPWRRPRHGRKTRPSPSSPCSG